MIEDKDLPDYELTPEFLERLEMRKPGVRAILDEHGVKVAKIRGNGPRFALIFPDHPTMTGPQFDRDVSRGGSILVIDGKHPDDLFQGRPVGSREYDVRNARPGDLFWIDPYRISGPAVEIPEKFKNVRSLAVRVTRAVAFHVDVVTDDRTELRLDVDWLSCYPGNCWVPA